MRFFEALGLRSYGLSFKKPHFFHSKLFFQRLWENFLCIVWPCLIYLKGAPNIVIYVIKKIRNIRHVKQIMWQETWKSLDFFEDQLQKWGWEAMGYPSKTPFFHPKLFFQKLLENFLCIVWLCSIYLKDASNIVFHGNKKIGTVRQTNQKIFTKPRKKNPF